MSFLLLYFYTFVATSTALPLAPAPCEEDHQHEGSQGAAHDDGEHVAWTIGAVRSCLELVWESVGTTESIKLNFLCGEGGVEKSVTWRSCSFICPVELCNQGLRSNISTKITPIFGHKELHGIHPKV